MAQPTDDLIIWASSDVNLPNLAGPNKTRPIDDLILKGWDFKEKPTADEFNYVLNNMGQYISYLLNKDTTYTFSGDVTGSVNSSGSVTNIRLGTEVSFLISNATGTRQYAAGYVLVGATNDGNLEVDTLYTRPLQQYIDGIWYTIGNI